MNPTLSPIFLNAAGNHVPASPKDVIILRFPIDNPTTGNIFTVEDEATVTTIYKGENHVESIPAGTTAVSFLADKNTDIIIIGNISKFNISGTYNPLKASYVMIDSSVISSLGLYSSGTEERFLNEILIKRAPLVTSFSTQNAINLSKIDLSGLTNATNIVCSGCKTLTTIKGLSECLALTTLNCEDCYNLSNPLDLSNQTLLTTVSLNNCFLLEEVVFPETSTLTTININSTLITSVVLLNNSGLSSFSANYCAIENLDISASPSITTLTVSGNTTIRKIKYRATNSTPAANIASLITNATASDGVVYLNSDDTYYQTVADAATAKGWTIEALPA